MSLIRLVFIVFIEQVTMNREGKSMIYYRKCKLVCTKKYNFIFENIYPPLMMCYVDFRIKCL